jgi:hypothetical protein
VSAKEEGYERTRDWEGTRQECDSIVLGAIKLGRGKEIKKIDEFTN